MRWSLENNREYKDEDVCPVRRPESDSRPCPRRARRPSAGRCRKQTLLKKIRVGASKCLRTRETTSSSDARARAKREAERALDDARRHAVEQQAQMVEAARRRKEPDDARMNDE